MLKPKRKSPPESCSDPAAFRRLCVETFNLSNFIFCLPPAAFRRLCVETLSAKTSGKIFSAQPPLGGCVLKLFFVVCGVLAIDQPPSGGCVLKPVAEGADVEVQAQPSSVNHMSTRWCFPDLTRL